MRRLIPVLALIGCKNDPFDSSGVLDSEAIPCEELLWYADSDGDGYGDPLESAQSCEAPSDFVANADDCDDGDAAINPEGEEVCDGVDNDCDGTVDQGASDASTWYVDADGDGFGDPDAPVQGCEQLTGWVDDATDCDDTNAKVYPDADEFWYDDLDSDCDGVDDPDVCEQVPAAAWILDDPTCVFDAADPIDWSIEVEWHTDDMAYSAGGSYTRVMMTPVVGQLTDDNGDGVVDDLDVPDIAYNTFTGGSYASAGYLRVISGDGSGEHLSVTTVVDSDGTTYALHSSGGIALGDIDADGSPDIVTMSTAGQPLALEKDGSLKWAASSAGTGYAYPSIADMDADGLAEVIVGSEIYGHDGTLLGSAGSNGNYHAFAADLDGDGVLQHMGGNAVHEMDGTLVWEDTSVATGYPAVADWDGDGKGDLINSRNGVITIWDAMGTQILNVDTGISTLSGGTCVGDLDGDGAPELAVAGRDTMLAMDNDGSVMWTGTTSDGSSWGTPCTAWDFNGDGAWEVLHADEEDFVIWDGATGAKLYVESGHGSGTIREQPVMADVDRDGSTEIVLANNSYYRGPWDGVYVLGEANDQWTNTRTVWNQSTFWSGNLEEDMSVPMNADMPWDLDNSFRAQTSVTAEPLAAQDFRVEILGVCEDCEASAVEVWVAVENGGAIYAPAGVEVSLYADDGGTWTLLETQATDVACEAGERLAPLTFVVGLDQIGADGLVAQVDDDGTGAGQHSECDETNNSHAWNEEVCAD